MINSFKKQLLTQLGIALGAVTLMIFAAQFIAGDLGAHARKILNQKSELAFRTQATGQLATLKADSDKAQPLFTALNGALPLKDDLINFGQSLILVAKNEKIDLGFNFGGETAPKGDIPGFIRFSITGSGSYENFQKFLKDLEKSRYFVKLNSIDLTRQPGNTAYSILADGQVFYQ